MRRFLLIAFLAIPAWLLAPLARCQSDSMIHINQFPGTTVADKVTNAMAHCPAAPIPCYLVIDASLAAAASGTMPTLPANAQLIDFRKNWANPAAISAKTIAGVVYPDQYATGGDGSSGAPWTGWESAIDNAAAASTIFFRTGFFSTSSQLTYANGVEIKCAGNAQTTIRSSFAGYTFVAANKAGNFLGASLHDCQLDATVAGTDWVDADSVMGFKFYNNLITWDSNHTVGTVANNGIGIRFDSTQSPGYYGSEYDNIWQWCGICVVFPSVTNSSLGGGNETDIFHDSFQQYDGIDIDISDLNANGGPDHISVSDSYFAGVVSESIYCGSYNCLIHNNSFEPQVGFAGQNIILSATSCQANLKANKVSGTSTLWSDSSTLANCISHGARANFILDSVSNDSAAAYIPRQFFSGQWLFLEPENFTPPTAGNAVSYIYGKGSGNGSSLYVNNSCLEWMDASGGQRCVLQMDSSNNFWVQNNAGTLNLGSAGVTGLQIQSTLISALVPIKLNSTRMAISDQGTCAMTAGACSAQSLHSTYSAAPNCVATWTGTGTLTGELKVTSTTTTLTPTSSVNTDTATVNYACFGN